MAKQTPVKIKNVDCFVCCVDTSRTINIHGRKSKNEGFLDKLNVIVNNESVFICLLDTDTTVVC